MQPTLETKETGNGSHLKVKTKPKDIASQVTFRTAPVPKPLSSPSRVSQRSGKEGTSRQTDDMLAAVREPCNCRSFVRQLIIRQVFTACLLCAESWKLAVNKATALVSGSSLPSRERKHIRNAVLGVGTWSSGSLQEGCLVQSVGLERVSSGK